MTKTLGLALGSGGARGWAHIGVIRALQAAHIPIDYVAGTSIGAFVGGIYAAGHLDELEGFVRQLDWKMVLSYFDLTFPSRGLLDGNRVYELLSDHLGEIDIDDVPIPFRCVATDIVTGKPICLQSGSMVEAIRASISIPGVFTPLEKENTFLADGGIINPVPVDLAKAMGADVVLAVNLSRHYGAIVEPDPVAAETETPNISATEEEYLATLPENSLYPQFLGRFKEQLTTVKDGLQNKLDQWATPTKTGPNIFDVIGNAISIMEQRVTYSNFQMHPPDLVIEPNLSQYGVFDFQMADVLIQTGYQSTRRIIPQIQQLLES